MLGEIPATIPLRTLDAIHLATCKESRLYPLLTLDKVMLAAAAYFNLPVFSWA